MNSRLYTGMVAHRRSVKIDHGFRYPIFMAYIDLAELDTLPLRWPLFSARRRAIVEFRRSDYLGENTIALDQAVRDLVQEQTGRRPSGPIRVLSHLRTFGFVFNPVTFYYCFDEAGANVETIVAEITNTPWNERHSYVLTPALNRSTSAGRFQFRIGKVFHVSPFLDMDYQYDMTFSEPGERVNVQIENRKDGQLHFVASLLLKEQPFTAESLAATLLRYPFMTMSVFLGIYWQALKLKLKGATYYSHPESRSAALWKEAA